MSAKNPVLFLSLSFDSYGFKDYANFGLTGKDDTISDNGL